MNRDQLIQRASWVSIGGNALLSAAKLAVGFFGNSLAVLGDGIDSAADVVVSCVMLATAHIMQRPPDKKYVYGYEKAEGIATKVLSLIVLYAGVRMLVSSVQSIFSYEARAMPSMLAIWVTVASIAGKLLLSWGQAAAGKRAGSQMLIANAANMRTDVLTSCAVLAGLFFTFILKMPLLDAVTGLLISLIIIRTGWQIFMSSNVELMDGVDDPKIYDKIFAAVARVSEAHNPHKVRSRQSGGRYVIVLDIEVDGDMTVAAAHEVAHCVEENIRAEIENVYDIVVHVEPSGACRMAEPFGISVES